MVQLDDPRPKTQIKTSREHFLCSKRHIYPHPLPSVKSQGQATTDSPSWPFFPTNLIMPKHHIASSQQTWMVLLFLAAWTNLLLDLIQATPIAVPPAILTVSFIILVSVLRIRSKESLLLDQGQLCWRKRMNASSARGGQQQHCLASQPSFRPLLLMLWCDGIRHRHAGFKRSTIKTRSVTTIST